MTQAEEKTPTYSTEKLKELRGMNSLREAMLEIFSKIGFQVWADSLAIEAAELVRMRVRAAAANDWSNSTDLIGPNTGIVSPPAQEIKTPISSISSNDAQYNKVA